MINVTYLPKNQEYIKVIAKWLNLWQNKSEEETIKVLNNSIDNNTLPKTIIITKDEIIIGFYQIVENDLNGSNYTPWLANVYIDETKRNQGYSKKLLESLPDILSDLNINKIYLHSRLINYYEKFGWKKLKEINLNDGIKRYIYTYEKI